jgi:hypothetical protein
VNAIRAHQHVARYNGAAFKFDGYFSVVLMDAYTPRS